MKINYSPIQANPSYRGRPFAKKQKQESTAIIPYNFRAAESKIIKGAHIQHLRPPRDFVGTSIQRNPFIRWINDVNSSLDRSTWPSTHDLHNYFRKHIDGCKPSGPYADLMSPHKKTRNDALSFFVKEMTGRQKPKTPEEHKAVRKDMHHFKTKADPILHLSSRLFLNGFALRERYTHPAIKKCIKDLFSLTIGETKSEEVAIKKLQGAASLYHQDNFRFKFEAPILRSFRGLEGGSGDDYEKSLKCLKELTRAYKDILDFLLECVSEPGFFDEIHREMSFFDILWNNIQELFEKTGKTAISFYQNAHSKSSWFFSAKVIPKL